MKQQAEALAPRPIYKVAVSRVRAAELLDVSTDTFDDWVLRGLMPKGVKIGALRRWDTEEIRASWYDIKEQGLSGDEDDGENPFDHAVG
ncbi:DNA-binding protein [Mesorhizobium sp. NBSH29]|uniref:helix-turn-helix transcriptional regulator n=1 Tax=Mesorhizobium sp. NBSH29 TaxID=2654249 RepID=UPI00189664EF|nr:DNA-binding protein [Mesorhizobium sp. NBSH29]QPC88344.1 DNA-binding protein [Mesorhizobium sp. NBSH29]